MRRRAKSDSGRRSSEIEDAQGKTVLPIGRRMKGRLALEGSLAERALHLETGRPEFSRGSRGELPGRGRLQRAELLRTRPRVRGERRGVPSRQARTDLVSAFAEGEQGPARILRDARDRLSIEPTQRSESGAGRTCSLPGSFA